MRSVIVTGGRAPATLDLCRALEAGGCRVIVAESLPFTVAGVSRAVRRTVRVPRPRQDRDAFAEALLEIAEREGADAIVPTCEEVFHVGLVRERLAQRLEVFTPTAAELARLHHKGAFAGWTAELGLDTPATEVVTDAAVLRARIREDGPALVCKPAWSRFATRVRVGPTDAAWVDGVEVSDAVPWVVQERIVGRQVCSWSVVRDGRVQAHAVYDMAFAGSAGAALRYTSADIPEVDAWVARFAAETGLTGQLAFDFIVHPDRGPLALECNPRLTSGVHLFSRDRRLAEAFFGELSEPIRPLAQAPSGLWSALLIYGGPTRREMGLGPWLRAVAQTRDPLMSLLDPAPFFAAWVSWGMLSARGRRLGIPPIEASTWDIEWNGEGSPLTDR